MKKKRRKQRKLDMAVATIQQQYGPWALTKGRAIRTEAQPEVPHIATGFPRLDRALGIGGLPCGRICELAGPATSGKTTLALKFLAQAQAGNAQVGYVDQALYFDPDYAYRCGLDLSRLVVGKTHDVPEALSMIEALTRSKAFAAMIMDVQDIFWTDPGTASRLAATLNRLPLALSRSGAILVVLHESPDEHASPALSTLSHSAAVRLHITRERWLERHGDIRGYRARIEIRKNRLAAAGRTATIDIEFNGTVRGNGL